MIIKIDSPKYGEKEILIDDEDFIKFKKLHWYLWKAPKHSTFYLVSNKSKTQKQLKLHRYLLNIINPKIYIDHANGNGLDNRKENLRISKNGGNNQNRKKQKNKSSSTYKGVCKNKKRNTWEASITKNYKKYFLGNYPSEIEAAKAYDKAAVQYHGQYASLNFPST